jgi:hypothetical protein
MAATALDTNHRPSHRPGATSRMAFALIALDKEKNG